jgi:hypothetical protein
MPFALASSADALFQASKPAGPLPHCAAFAFGLTHASIAKVAKVAVVSFLPLIIRKSLGFSELMRPICAGAKRHEDDGEARSCLRPFRSNDIKYLVAWLGVLIILT